MEGHQLGLLFSDWLIPLRINLSLVVVVLTPQFISVSNWLKNLKQSKFLTSIFLIINFRSFAFTKVSVNPLSLFPLLFYSNVFWSLIFIASMIFSSLNRFSSLFLLLLFHVFLFHFLFSSVISFWFKAFLLAHHFLVLQFHVPLTILQYVLCCHLFLT